MPFFQVSNLARALDALKKENVWVVGTSDHAEKLIYETDLTGPLALVMGAEGKGLRRLTIDSCDLLVKLPMKGKVSSLNVSVAAGICLFEALRQRDGLGLGAYSYSSSSSSVSASSSSSASYSHSEAHSVTRGSSSSFTSSSESSSGSDPA